jgi:2,5-dihydroxypyridine 5,6-dioxygenase
VVIYTDTQKDQTIPNSFFIALRTLGVEPVLVFSTPRNDPDRRPLPVVTNALEGAELLIDLAWAAWIYTEPFSRLLDGGVRILSSMASVDTCLKMAPDLRYADRARAGARLLDAGVEIAVRSSAGTHLVVRKDGRRGHYRDGLLRDEGEIWDNFPACHCTCAPREDSAEGRLVISPGDIILTLRHIVETPICCEIAGGRIRSIAGGKDASLLARWLEQWRDERSYVLAHIGFGCDDRADVSAMQLMEWEALAGGIMIAFGSNASRFLGGANRAASHLDVVLRSADFFVDGEQIIRGGTFVHPDLMLGGESGKSG